MPVDATLSFCTPNQPVEQDLEMIKDLGLDPNRDRHGFSDQGDSGGN